ncbi:hypothetical protein ACH5RR_007238 [Cinchona calisaya]|uniref:J domain-containing protein n=1 Tax=Cinchona calisaya TaxID=153742 RepID=A0ABD3AR75_9GENT
MSPAAADFVNPISSPQPFSQNPNPSYPSSNGSCQPQSTSFNIESSNGIRFDFSKKGSDSFGQPKPPRVRVPMKKKRGKLCSSENVLGSDGLNRACEASSFDNVFGAVGSGFRSVVKDGNEGFSIGNGSFVFEANKDSSTSNCSNGNGSFVFGATKDSSTSNFSNGNESFVFGHKKDSLTSNCSNGNGSFVFGDHKDSSVLNSNSGNVGSMFGAEESSLRSNLNGKGDSFLSGADKISVTINTSNRNVVSVSGANASASTLNSSSGNGSFVFGVGKSNLTSNLDLIDKESGGSVRKSGADELRIFDNVGFVFGAEKSELASDSKLEQKGSNNDPYVSSGVSESAKFSKTGFVFGTISNVGGEKYHSGLVFGSKQKDSKPNAQPGKTKIGRRAKKWDFVRPGNKNPDIGNGIPKADVNGFPVFGNNSEEKPSSNASSNYSNEANPLDGEKAKNGSTSVKFPFDATKSNFKFVIGSSSSPGRALYKIPLSKLFDEMKNLNIDNSKSNNGADRAKVAGSNSWFGTDNKFVFEFESKSKTSAQVFGQENQASNLNKEVLTDNVLPQDQPVNDSNLNFSSSFSSSATGHVQQNRFGFEAPPTTKVENKVNISFTSTPVRPDACSREFNSWSLNESSSFTANPFPGLSEKSEFSAYSRDLRDKKLRKTRGKLRKKMAAKNLAEQDHVSKKDCSPSNFESQGCCSPMDFSPYRGTTGNAQGSSCTSMATDSKAENFAAGSQRSDINEGDKRIGEEDDASSKVHHESSLKSSASSSAQDGLSAIRRQYRKKYKLKVGDGLNRGTAVQKSDSFSSSAQFSPNASNSSCTGRAQEQNGVTSNSRSKADRQHAKQDPIEDVTYGACEQWRIRGNQAYKSRDLHKAEEYYSKGINSVKVESASGFSFEPLLLCYSNRAATRMSLGRMREAVEDCKSAAAVDPKFLKVKLRAANCHLVLGEFKEAMEYYNKCLESGNDVCLDRRIRIEAADGLQKAQKVADYMCQSAELLQQRSSDAASYALTKVVEGLSISRYSEKLLKWKGEALFLLRRYDEVIELCEQTLRTAEKNFTAIHLVNDDHIQCKNSVRLWRWCLMSKAYFHLGRLELALDLIEKQEQLTSISDRSAASMNQGTSISLAANIRELLHQKKAGNGAFQSGKYAEAIEHYTAAIASSVDSRPFAAICFCNRAAAHQALGLIVDAIADCSLAIALDGDYLKAVSRRATLHEMIRDYKQAINDLQRLVSLLENQSHEKAEQYGKKDGSNESNRKELKQARDRLSLIEDKAKKETPMDFYLILGIKASDTESDIKKAYRKAALKRHPDKAGQYLARSDGGDDGRSWKDIVEKVHEDADRLFKMIAEAYAVLSDPDKRLNYDHEEETRNFCSDSYRNSDSGRSSDFYSSPYDRGHWSGRPSNFSSSPFGRSRK